MPASRVAIFLAEEKPNENAPRRIKLDEASDSCLVGRASSKGIDILAQPDNGYFENPVVSRNHAEIRADFFYERVYIKDIGSTHGTFVNNIRIPATVQHPLRTGDTLSLGVAIKNQGVEVAQPSTMKVGIKWWSPRAPLERGPNVFEVPDESSVSEFEESEPEDLLDRARRFLNAHGNVRAPQQATIDLTQDPDLPPNILGDGSPVPGRTEDEGVDEDRVEAEVDDEVKDGGREASAESDYSGLEADYDVQEIIPEEDAGGIQEAGQPAAPPLEASIPHSVADVGSRTYGTGHALPIPEAVPLYLNEQLETGEIFEDGNDLSESNNNNPSAVEGEDVTIPIPGAENDPPPEVGGFDESIMEAPAPTDAPTEEAHAPEVDVHPPVSKKRKASAISKAEEPQEFEMEEVRAVTEASMIPASGVQTEVSEVREPKRLRSAADIVGYAALGGLAGGLALFTTLVVSAPSFS